MQKAPLFALGIIVIPTLLLIAAGYVFGAEPAAPYAEQVLKVAKARESCERHPEIAVIPGGTEGRLQRCIEMVLPWIIVFLPEDRAHVDTSGFSVHPYDGNKIAVSVPDTKPQLYIEMPAQ
jgi:hypothetical protein